jgi:hypothetical protein
MHRLTELYALLDRFCDTLLSLRSFKSCLREEARHPKSRLNLWFRNTYDRIASLLPVYFDRIQAFSAPLYGYDTSALLQAKKVDTEWNAAVIDVLRRQERSGTPMAFILVLDAESAGTANLQKGLQLASLASHNDCELDDDRIRWPALYVRSTLHLTSVAQSSSRPASTQGSSGYLNSSSQGSILQNWSISGNPSTSSLVSATSTKAPLAFSKASVLEYAPESGNASWPHSEWHRVSILLRNRKPHERSATDGDNGALSRIAMSAVTYRDDEEDCARPFHVSQDSMRSLDGGSGLFGASTSFEGSPRKVPPADPTSKENPSSVFHTCPVSDLLTLVAMVGVEGDDHRWRRRSGLTDQEIREILVELAMQLSVVRNFTVYNIPSNQQDNSAVKSLRYSFRSSQAPSATVQKLDASVLTKDGSSPTLSDEFVRGFLKDVKMVLGLRPVNPLAHDALRSTATLSPTSRRFLAQRASTVSASSSSSSLLGLRRGQNRPFEKETERFDGSALNLFLGSDLASMFS